MMKRKKVILLIFIIIIILSILAYVIYKNKIVYTIFQDSNVENSSSTINEVENEELKEVDGCKYNHFQPVFENGYDYTQDMKYKDKIYRKTITDYKEYMIYKTRWNDICNMTEDDFKKNFMIITAVENTSMMGLDIKQINLDGNTLFIDLDNADIEYDKNKMCMSIIIPNDLMSENIEIRDYRKVKETPEYIYGWKNDSIDGLRMLSQDEAVQIAKKYVQSLVSSDSLEGKYLEKYTKLYEVTLTEKAPNNYWLITDGIIEREYKFASFTRKVYEVTLVPYDDDVEMDRAYFYVDAYIGKVIGGMEASD